MANTRSQRTLGELSKGTASTTIGNKEIKALVLDEAYPGCLPNMAPDGPDWVIYIYLGGYTMYIASHVGENDVAVSKTTMVSDALRSALVHVDDYTKADTTVQSSCIELLGGV